MSRDYDSSKDKLVHETLDVFADEYNRLSVSIYVYGDTGKPKVQISRERKEKGKDWLYTKLGRMTLAEFSAVARATKAAFEAVERGETQTETTKPEGW